MDLHIVGKKVNAIYNGRCKLANPAFLMINQHNNVIMLRLELRLWSFIVQRDLLSILKEMISH